MLLQIFKTHISYLFVTFRYENDKNKQQQQQQQPTWIDHNDFQQFLTGVKTQKK